MILRLPLLCRFPPKPGRSPSKQIPWRGPWSSSRPAPPRVQRLGWARFLIDTGTLPFFFFFFFLKPLPGLFWSLDKFALLLWVMAKLREVNLLGGSDGCEASAACLSCSSDVLRHLRGIFKFCSVFSVFRISAHPFENLQRYASAAYQHL